MDLEDAPVPRQAKTPLADVGTLIDMGAVEEQPKPPPDLPPDPPAEEQANTAALDTALSAAGITKAPADADAIAELAKLDPAVIEVITRWVHGDSAGPVEEVPPDPLPVETKK